MNTRETLGQRLRRLREAAGYTPEGLASRAGVPLVSYRNWEYDHRLPGLGAASRLAKALRVPLQDLADCVEDLEDGRHQPRRGRAGDAGEEPGPEPERAEAAAPRRVEDGRGQADGPQPRRPRRKGG